MQRYKQESLTLTGCYPETPHGRFDISCGHVNYPRHAQYLQWAHEAVQAYRAVQADRWSLWCPKDQALVHYAEDALCWLRRARNAPAKLPG
jgi:hypothetical protein